MNMQYDYYVKRWRNGGYYAVCFSSVTKLETQHIIDNVNKELELKDETGTNYTIREVGIPSGIEYEYDYTTEFTKENAKNGPGN